ncbi:hypothetical protein OH76DRAFT_1404725 [Lentinus brumalis]|uniref:Uncharacterized protein n=1 Tax=Lentinus brumalis TaxID=2498619 RepID=A0A371D7G7_9APHY|nr:hypothetical protein OH76DRAFT_1404725 [Polyporus brumalis]
MPLYLPCSMLVRRWLPRPQCFPPWYLPAAQIYASMSDLWNRCGVRRLRYTTISTYSANIPRPPLSSWTPSQPYETGPHKRHISKPLLQNPQHHVRSPQSSESPTSIEARSGCCVLAFSDCRQVWGPNVDLTPCRRASMLHGAPSCSVMPSASTRHTSRVSWTHRMRVHVVRGMMN